MVFKTLLNESDIPLAPATIAALYNAPVPIFIARDDGKMLLINRTIQKATGLKPENMPTVDAWMKTLTPFPDTDNETQSSFLFKKTGTLETFQVSVTNKSCAPLIWQFFHVPLDANSEGLKIFLSIAQDITDSVVQQKYMETLMDKLEQQISTRTEDLNSTIAKLENEIIEKNRISDALALSREHLKKISRHTLDILEADRQTISKELHDSIGASLAAVKFSLEEKEMKRNENENQLNDSLNQEVGYLAATIKETKRISANLRPSTLDELGLAATIAWYLRQFQRMYGDIQIKYFSEIAEKDVPEAMKINIYRIIQEGLTNAERHSQASTILLSIKYCDGRHSISLSIEDNGCGFNVKEILSNKDPLGGYGLIAMRERCEISGGVFHLDSKIGKGTRIAAILPIK
ncbi:MAG: ATP-binding protein [Desulforhopalus sp.]